MKLYGLAAETSTDRGSLALFENKKCVDFIDWASAQSHSEVITIHAEKLLTQNNLKVQHLNEFYVSLGPGSFTGVRVAINFIRALAFGLDKPVWTCDSLTLLAAPFLKSKHRIFALQSAFRNLFYASVFENSSPLLLPQAFEFENSSKYFEDLLKEKNIFIGAASLLVLKFLNSKDASRCVAQGADWNYPHAKNFEDLLSNSPTLLQRVNWMNVVPLYVRASEAEEKFKINQGNK